VISIEAETRNMNIQNIYSYLAYPSKHEEVQPEIGGAKIPHKGRLFGMLKEIFDKSEKECDIPICFIPEGSGTQNNEFRNDIIELIRAPGLPAGRKIAERLQNVTTGKSGMGLLFIILAKDGKNNKIMLSRFPADQGIMAEQNAKSLIVEFIEQVFLKNAHTYKSVIYRGSSFDADFWDGSAVDRQTNHGVKGVANYWIRDFLLSDFKTTAKAGTKRLAIALREAIAKADDLSIKHEITSAAVLAKNLAGKNTSVNDFFNQYHLSSNAKDLVAKQLKKSSLAVDKFQFDLIEYSSHISYKALEMDNGAILSAPMNKFDECFQEQTDKDSDIRTYSTTGKVVNEKLKKGK
jgi:hypothetical protein